MASASDYLEQALFNHIFRFAEFSKPTEVAIALLTNPATDAHTGATMPELPSANGYERVTNASGDAFWDAHGTAGPGDNASEIAFATATGNWGYVSGVAILDSNTHGAGNILVHSTLTTPRIVLSGDVAKFNAGELDITIS